MVILAETPSLAVPWRVVLPLALAVAALCVLLPRPRRRPVVLGSVLGLVAVVLAALLLTRVGGAPWPEQVLFYAFSGLAILGAGAMLTQRNPARAAISFALVVLSVCGLFLLEGAPFLMAATIIIYAGAIIVTFLFVLMLSQQHGFSNADDRTREPVVSAFAGFVLLGTILLVIEHTYPDMRPFDALVAKVDAASEQETLAGVDAAIGNTDAFAADWSAQRAQHRNSRWHAPLGGAIENVQADMNDPRRDLTSVKVSLKELAEAAHHIQDEARPGTLPAANVEGLGRLMYTNYLLPVEIGGTLLLVATIGAIAITHRRQERRPA